MGAQAAPGIDSDYAVAGRQHSTMLRSRCLPADALPGTPVAIVQASPVKGSLFEEIVMLHYALVFLVIALIAALFGFGGIAAGAAGIAKVLFFVFLVLFIASLIGGGLRRGRW
jgi:uncharacterized membrane protein YtjA (UPF0391 family)